MTLLVMPNSKIFEELSKNNFLVYCQRKDNLNYYIPDKLKLGQADINFL